MNKSIILLSGGLDSVVSLAYAKNDYNISLALTFDYGQRSKDQEIKAAADIAKYYGIEHKIIHLPWLEQITQTSLVNTNKELPDLGISNLDNLDAADESARRVWVPNRNGLFINIAASFADSIGYTHIIFGANREEATTFSDNSEEFIRKINGELEYSTLVHPQVFAPLIHFDKMQIVKAGLEREIPFNLIRSCYTNSDEHCGKCESCLRLKRALMQVGNTEICQQLFSSTIGEKSLGESNEISIY